jgi:hypothetical protein
MECRSVGESAGVKRTDRFLAQLLGWTGPVVGCWWASGHCLVAGGLLLPVVVLRRRLEYGGDWPVVCGVAGGGNAGAWERGSVRAWLRRCDGAWVRRREDTGAHRRASLGVRGCEGARERGCAGARA